MKVTDEQFLSALRENAGLITRTQKALERRHNITISRTAVYKRAQTFPEELDDIKQQNLDIAEDGLQGLMRSTNESIQLKAVTFFLRTQGKARGYVETTEVEIPKGNNLTFEVVMPKK